MTDIVADDERLARAQLTYLAEPGDELLGVLVRANGAVRAVEVIRSGCLMGALPPPVSGGDASDAQWIPVDAILADPSSPTPTELAFDHCQILADAVERVRSKLEYTTLATAFCPHEFTIAELRRVYEIVWGQPLDPPNFHRKVKGIPGLLTPTDATTSRDGGRPAQLYRRGPATHLHPPILRMS